MAITLSTCTGTQHRVVLTCDHYSFLPPISFIFFLWDFCFTSVFMSRALLVVGASSCACSTRSLTTFTVGHQVRPLARYPFISFVVFMHEGCFNLWPITLCCRTGTQHRVVVTCDHNSFLPPVSLIFFLSDFSFVSVLVVSALALLDIG